MAGPWLAVRAVRVDVVAAPSDAVAGDSVVLEVVASGACRCTPLRPGGAATMLRRNTSTPVECLLDRRGVLEAVELRIAAAAPFGLLWWSLCRRVALPYPLLVAPRPAAADRLAPETGGPGPAAGAPRRSQAATLLGELRGVREYRVGDSPRQVHWRATAHSAGLMVKENEGDDEQMALVVADMTGDPDSVELRASGAIAGVAAHLARGSRVTLETIEESGSQSASVADLRGAGRRLAGAGRNPWAEP